jgi:hypothetical protein
VRAPRDDGESDPFGKTKIEVMSQTLALAHPRRVGTKLRDHLATKPTTNVLE